VVLLVLARALAPAEFGILAIAALTYNVLIALNQLGVSDALTYLQDRIEQASRTALTIVILFALILIGVTWAVAPLIAHFFHSPGATFVLRGFTLGIPFDAAAQVPIGRLTRALGFARRTVTDAVPQLIGATVTIGIVVAGHPIWGLVVGQVVGSVSNAVVAMIIGPACLPGWDPVTARQLLAYGKYLSAADILNLGLLNVDYIIVGHVLGPRALGLYSLAYRLCFMPYLAIPVVANGALFPYYCRLPTKQAKARTAESAIALITTLSIPWFAGLVLFAGDIALLGAKWAPATGSVRFLAIYGFFLTLILSFLEVLKAVGRTNLVFVSRCVHLALLAGVLVATVRFGISVVALDQASVAAVVALLTAVWMISCAAMSGAVIVRSVGLPMFGVLGMAATVLVLSRIPALGMSPSWTGLLVLGPIALVVFAAIVWLSMPGPLRSGWAALRNRPVMVSDAGIAAPSAHLMPDESP
jgi:PST family polysaccharide transporter